MTGHAPQRPILRAYVDETGDRGMSGKASPFFSFAAVLIADEDEAPLRSTMSKLKSEMSIPPGKALHWSKHARTFARRQYVSSTLTATPDLHIVYVLVEKAAIPSSAIMQTNQVKFYNFAAGMVLERILLAARDWPGGSRQAVVRYGHVRGFDHSTTTAYIDHRIATNNPNYVPWHLLSGPIHFADQPAWDGLQTADQYAGMLHAAIRADEFGNYEPQHLLGALQQVRRVNGVMWGRGFKLLGNAATLHGFPWWPLTGM